MSYKIDKVKDAEIYVATFGAPYDPITDAAGIEKEMSENLKTGDGTVFYIADFREVDVTFSDLVVGLNEAFSSGLAGFYTNPRVKIIVVGDNQFVKLGTDAVQNQDQYGRIPIQLFTTVDEAVSTAKAQL